VNARRSTVPTLAAAAATALGAMLLLCPPATAKLVGGQVERRAASDPAAEVARLGKSSETVWLAWTVTARGQETICGFGHGIGSGWGMTLDDDESSWGTRDGAPAIAVSQVEVYAGVRDGAIRRLRFASEGCPVQAGSRKVLWLDGVTPAASLALLESLAARRGEAKIDEDLSERALAGLAFHADPAAALALVHLAREGQDDELRAQSLFWLAQSRDPRAARWIREAIARDPAGEVREQGVFALSQLENSTHELLALLRESADRDVKRQAIFWLGQSDDPRATAEIERLLTR
jgi:hypothetical protein